MVSVLCSPKTRTKTKREFVMSIYRKSETVYFRNGTNPNHIIKGRIAHVHRDGTYTVKALFYETPSEMKNKKGYLGDEMRMKGSWLSPTPTIHNEIIAEVE